MSLESATSTGLRERFLAPGVWVGGLLRWGVKWEPVALSEEHSHIAVAGAMGGAGLGKFFRDFFKGAHFLPTQIMRSESIEVGIACRDVAPQLFRGEAQGLEAAISYPESKFRLEERARLTLLTDGIIEARNKSGELFGFERTASISNQLAEAIALAAQRFG